MTMLCKKCTECGIAKPISEFGLRSASRDGHRSCCKQCDCARAKNLRSRPGAKEKADAWNAANIDKKRKHFRDYYSRNTDEEKARTAKYRSDNPDWAYTKRRERVDRQKMATPGWADMSAIDGMYKIAAAMRRNGADVCVDHIVPLASKLVCGLHVKSNLQIIPSSENSSKYNRYWPHMPEGI